MNQLFQARTKKLMTAPVLARPKGELDVTKNVIVEVTKKNRSHDNNDKVLIYQNLRLPTANKVKIRFLIVIINHRKNLIFLVYGKSSNSLNVIKLD